MRRHLVRQGYPGGLKRVRRLMRLMELMPIYQKPRTSVPDAEHEHFFYLLSNLEITHSNQVWCSDITDVPMERGFFIFGGCHGLAKQKNIVLGVVQHV